MKRKITLEDKKRFSMLSELGCIICLQPAEIHHLKGIEFGSGIGIKAPHKFTIPLCPNHHRGADGFHVIGKKTWEARFSTQKHLLTITNDKIKMLECLK